MPVRFKPWTPAADPRIDGVRLLVLGESHYEETGFCDRDAREDLTCEIVARWGRRPQGRQVFFANIYTVFTGERWTIDADGLQRFWDNILFYNYIQKLVPGGPRNAPSSEMWATAASAFRETLEDLRPDAVLAMGGRLWNNMATEDCKITSLKDGVGLICGYRLHDGVVIAAAHTNHPSSIGFSPESWRPKVVEFLGWVRKRPQGPSR